MTPKLNKDRAMYRDYRKLQFLFDVAHKAGWDSKKDRKQPRRGADAAINYLESKGFIVTVDNRYFPEGTRYKITRSLGAGTYQPINELSDLSDPNITQAGSSKHPGLLGVAKPVRKKRSKRGLYL